MINETTYSAYLDLLLAGDVLECKRIVKDLIGEGVEVRDLYVNLFQRSLYTVGTLWELNQISVATEHLVTSITQSLMSLIYPMIFSAEHIGRKAVIACVANEYHQVGARMVADIFELNGWDGYFLGANTPEQDVVEIIGEKSPDLVGFSLSLYFNAPNLRRLVDAVRSSHPSLPIIVGGQAFRHGGAAWLTDHPGVTYVDSLYTLEQTIKNF